MLFHLATRDIFFTCGAISGAGDAVAQLANQNAYWDIEDAPWIKVDMSLFDQLDPESQSAVLWHELLHLEFGPHPDGIRDWKRFREADQLTACEDLCFKKKLATKCSCARCLGTDICDPRCAPYKGCAPQLGVICPCPKGKNAYKWFPTCQECLSRCPSGLGCFGHSRCRPIDVSCTGRRTTCP
jgi:hypothetical protein